MKKIDITFLACNEADEDRMDLDLIIKSLQSYRSRCSGELSVPMRINTKYESIPIFIEVTVED